MVKYKFGDRVIHPEYGRCIFVAYNDPNKLSASVVDTGNDWIKHVNAVDLTPADLRIIKIGGVYHRVFTPLDTEEARELIGKMVRYSDTIEELAGDGTAILQNVEKGPRPYGIRGKFGMWAFIALPIETQETEPEKKPTADQVCEYIAAHPDIIRDAVRKAMEEEAKG